MPTTKQKLAFGKYVEKRGKVSLFQAMMIAGYSPNTAKNVSQNLTKSRGFQELLETELPDDLLLETHKSLLQAKRVEHMVFPLYKEPAETTIDDGPPTATEGFSLTDGDIVELLATVGGTVKKIVHGEQARHVYFWVANDKARQDALKLAYDIKGKTKIVEPPTSGDQYNMFIQNNQINPNDPEPRKLVESTLAVLMEQTRRLPHAPKPTE